MLVGQDEQQIDIGPRRQRASAIAAHRGDGERLGARGVFARIDVAGGPEMGGADQFVLSGGQHLGTAGAAAVGDKLGFGGDAGIVEPLTQGLEHGGAGNLAVGRGIADFAAHGSDQRMGAGKPRLLARNRFNGRRRHGQPS